MHEVSRWTNQVHVAVGRRLFTTREAVSTCILAAVSAACSAGLCVAAVLLHPPLAIVPLVVIACIGCPVFGTWELPDAVAALRQRRAAGKRQTIARFRRSLDRLPEVDHPLGR